MSEVDLVFNADDRTWEAWHDGEIIESLAMNEDLTMGRLALWLSELDEQFHPE